MRKELESIESDISFDADQKLPNHVAFIMDGNGRWAKQKGRNRTFGHRKGVSTVRMVLEKCAQWGIPFLTLYGFSTENWNRPRIEVDALMNLLIRSLNSELKNLMKNNIRLSSIGDLNALPPKCKRKLLEVQEATKENTRTHLVLALSYSSKQELVHSTRQIAKEVKEGKLAIEDISEDTIKQRLFTADIPDPDLLVRTGGEHRLSNFLLWQLAYCEFVFVEPFWPEFSENDFKHVLKIYQTRERRFGKTSEQVKNT